MVAIAQQKHELEVPAACDAHAILAQHVAEVGTSRLDREPVCHSRVGGGFPEDAYERMLQHLPDMAICTPFNLRHYRRSNGESTRDEFYLTKDNLRNCRARRQ